MYQFQSILYPTSNRALRAVAEAWIWGGMPRPYPETLVADPVGLASECIEAWSLADVLRDWGVGQDALADAMRVALDVARSERA